MHQQMVAYYEPLRPGSSSASGGDPSIAAPTPLPPCPPLEQLDHPPTDEGTQIPALSATILVVSARNTHFSSSLLTQYSVVTILLPHSPLNPNPPGVTARHVPQIWLSSTQIVWSNLLEKARFAGEKGLCVVEIGGLRLLLALEYQGIEIV
ncbi:hypothetical protein PIB30_062111 [Stylosanthes scabra]|uniref:Uncharacterized protein n=1 Tax=Stylosanthes scabra TaxID=79078 RepID=A0ABU6TKU1_9FABA|nr:hypothetical protein [Stylosanthes scabra]